MTQDQGNIEEQVMMQTIDIASILRMKDEHVANISHELRLPLTSILCMAEALQDELLGPLVEEQRTALGMIVESGRHLLALIIDLLDLAKFEAGKMELHCEKMDIAEGCHTVMNMVRQFASEKELLLDFTVDSRLDWLYADPVRITQLLVNLLNNAINYTPNSGTISLQVLPDPQEQNVCFSVSDNGIGMSSDQIAEIFRPFVRFESRLLQQNTGTGLGLSIVRCIVELHGGSITVQSQPGEGTRVTVTIPMIEAGEQVSSVTTSVSSDKSARDQATTRDEAPTVLLVYDNESMRKQLMEQIASYGYQVAVASGGAQGIESALAMHPDMILMDLQMTGIDGLRATYCLRQLSATAKTPIIGLSTLRMPGDSVKFAEVGLTDHFVQPITTARLRDMLQRYLPVTRNRHRQSCQD